MDYRFLFNFRCVYLFIRGRFVVGELLLIEQMSTAPGGTSTRRSVTLTRRKSVAENGGGGEGGGGVGIPSSLHRKSISASRSVYAIPVFLSINWNMFLLRNHVNEFSIKIPKFFSRFL